MSFSTEEFTQTHNTDNSLCHVLLNETIDDYIFRVNNQKVVVCRAMLRMNRPVTCMEIYEYFVNNNYLQVYTDDEPKPTPLSLNHIIFQHKGPPEYRARISRALWSLEKDDNMVTITRDERNRNVYTLDNKKMLWL